MSSLVFSDLHLVLDGAEEGAGDEVPEDGGPVPAAGHGVLTPD